ncbi:hypothetical protein ACW18Q_03330 [Limosilactobacillus reuteri]
MRILIIGFMINFNEEQFEQLIIYAQIVLSIALPFTLYPLVALTGDEEADGTTRFIHHGKPSLDMFWLVWLLG